MSTSKTFYAKSAKGRSAKVASARGMNATKVRKIASSVINSNAEQKFLTTESINTYTSIDATGSVTHLSAVPQGDTDLTRDGDSLTLISLQFKMAWLASGDTSNMCRCIIFQWYGNTTPVIGNVLPGSGAVGAVLEPYVHDGRKMFSVLYDKTLFVNPVSIPGNMAVRNIYKIPKKKIFYFAGGTTTPINGIYMIFLSDSTAISHPSVVYSAKLNFYDY